MMTRKMKGRERWSGECERVSRGESKASQKKEKKHGWFLFFFACAIPSVIVVFIPLICSHAMKGTTSTPQDARTDSAKLQKALGSGTQKWHEAQEVSFVCAFSTVLFPLFSLPPRKPKRTRQNPGEHERQDQSPRQGHPCALGEQGDLASRSGRN